MVQAARRAAQLAPRPRATRYGAIAAVAVLVCSLLRDGFVVAALLRADVDPTAFVLVDLVSVLSYLLGARRIAAALQGGQARRLTSASLYLMATVAGVLRQRAIAARA